MSGSSGTSNCPRCNGVDTMQTSFDTKPHELISGQCYSCGYGYYTKSEMLTLEQVNEARKEIELEPITELAKPSEDWVKYFGADDVVGLFP
jgi:hypothetical protein